MIGARGGSQHGTRSRYVRGCRCTPCREANRLYMRWHLDQLARRPIPEELHGLASTYKNRGCRCDLCKLAGSIANAEYRIRRAGREAALDRSDGLVCPAPRPE